MPTANIQGAALKDQFASAWHFLKHNHAEDMGHSTPLIDLPWYLVIGPAQSGKTQLIIQSQFDFIDAPHLNTHPHDESEGEHRCNWWFTRKMTFIDVPGHYLTHNENVESDSDWQVFLNTLKPYITRKPLNGVILILDLAELGLLSKTEQKRYIQQLHATLFLLSKQVSAPCPLYLLLSKIDRVTGFNEFFGDLGKEERLQICGINLAQAPKAQASSLPRLFKMQFDQLIKRLQGRIVWRLHHERNITKRALITQFPLQLESFGSSLANVLYHLADIISLTEVLPLQGIYFVSSLQEGLPVDCLRKTTSQDLILPSSITSLPVKVQKQQSYFSKQLLHNIVANTAVLKHSVQRFSFQDKLRLSGYILAVTIITSSGLLMANNFNQRIAKLNAAQTALAQYNVLEQQLPPQNPDLGQTLPVINTLRQATQLIAQTQLTWFSAKARQLSPLANTTYHASLANYFLPNLSTMLEHALSNSVNPDFTYGALKVYLMLGDPSHLDAKFVKNWFAHYWSQLFAQNPAVQQQLNDHLSALLAEPFTPVQLNQNIIAKTRTLLANTSAPQLAYAIVKSQVNGELINPISKTSEQTRIFNQIFQSGNATISSLYTKKLFADVYLNRIITASTTLLRGDWVLGATAHNNVNSNDLPDLVNQTRILYLKDYAAQWQALLNNIQLIPWRNWTQVQLALDNFLSRQSPFIHIIKAVNDNTDLQTLTYTNPSFNKVDLQIIDTNLSSQFASLSAFVQSPDGSQASGLNQAIIAFKNLQSALEPAAKDNTINKNAFLLAKSRFTKQNTSDPITALLQLAKTAPAPLQSWFTAIANNSWQLVLQSTAHYINSLWQQQVSPFYQANLNNRYPLNKSADTNISFADFTHFFSNNGILSDFFNDYLAPFIDTSHAQWQWQIVNGQMLNLANNVLPQLERAAIIRTMYFDNNDALIVPFSLKAVSFEPGITSFALRYGKEGFSDNQANQVIPHTLIWPSEGNTENVTLTFTDSFNRTFSTTINGPWALFRLIDKSNLQQLDNTQHYQLTFDYNGNAVRYQLESNKLINPFISGIVELFQCPTSLQ